MKRKKKRTKICRKCSEHIDLNRDHYIMLGSYNQVQRPDTQDYFHFFCWVDFFKEKVEERARKTIQGMQQQAMQIFNNPMIKGILSKVSGSEQLFGMLNLDLAKKQAEQKPQIRIIKEKIENGRTRRTNNRRRSKANNRRRSKANNRRRSRSKEISV